MSWDDAVDMPFPLPAGGGGGGGGWVDAWTVLRPEHESQCSTYDGIWNEDLAVFNGFTANAGLVAEEEIGPVRVQAAGLQAGRHRVDREYGKPRD
ncbi:hypothetical protein EE612_039504 [Oryza sativa]|nr:hypothetical protein EE612_039504 [Oryza sativa]